MKKIVLKFLTPIISFIPLATFSCQHENFDKKNFSKINENKLIHYSRDEYSSPPFNIYIENFDIEQNNKENIRIFELIDFENGINDGTLDKENSLFIKYLSENNKLKSYIGKVDRYEYDLIEIILKSNVNFNQLISEVLYTPVENNMKINIKINELENNANFSYKRFWLFVPKLWNINIDSITLEKNRYKTFSEIPETNNDLIWKNNSNFDYKAIFDFWNLPWNKNNLNFKIENTTNEKIKGFTTPTFRTQNFNDTEYQSIEKKLNEGLLINRYEINEHIEWINRYYWTNNDTLIPWYEEFKNYLANNFKPVDALLAIRLNEEKEYGIHSIEINKTTKEIIINKIITNVDIIYRAGFIRNDEYRYPYSAIKYFLLTDIHIHDIKNYKIIKKDFNYYFLENEKEIIWSPYHLNTKIIIK
ncbi:hypothetical protein VBM87_00910 [Mycoplasma sp. 744]|uniref:hypothetical protein n=1 Tax=Mycoplasma sp. 744 TaxID=3108531 RepID=UPI002B1E21F2|nr:hypothetical protein [Mycoplasma sp. 744]MEA4115345.1 hypothetical protein [Mycoplasma sp. 744]